MSTPKTLTTNISANNETQIRRIATALDAANKTAITFPATAPTPPPTPALPNEDLIVTRSQNALANTFLPTPRPYKAHRYLAMAKNSFCPPHQESPTVPTTLYTEWINTALDDLRDPGVWAEVTRFRTATNDLDVAQQAVTATRKQIEITVQKVQTSTQALTRRNAYHRIYPTKQAHKIHAAPGTTRRLARRLDNTRRPSSCTTTGQYSTTTRRLRAPRPRTLPPPTFNDIWGQTSAYRRGNVTEFSLQHY
ncbi:hypothetical protein B0F90DRAFT_1929786 [Multifurca ochricompacta]|uniref:Uncharacterized protein n=1 Tax=Multifurca ochricompacta TaxID=376703 RepID=A0AAD4LW65_9AGAM|nr:hypothetical protein B0F90DRAFT_1929786 [Multifurca ochricompacta]